MTTLDTMLEKLRDNERWSKELLGVFAEHIEQNPREALYGSDSMFHVAGMYHVSDFLNTEIQKLHRNGRDSEYIRDTVKLIDGIAQASIEEAKTAEDSFNTPSSFTSRLMNISTGKAWTSVWLDTGIRELLLEYADELETK